MEKIKNIWFWISIVLVVLLLYVLFSSPGDRPNLKLIGYNVTCEEWKTQYQGAPYIGFSFDAISKDIKPTMGIVTLKSKEVCVKWKIEQKDVLR